MARLPRILSASIIAASFALASQALAAWPDKPLKLIVPFQAGSSSDVIARIVAGKLGDRLGQQVVVDNRVGGGTIIGTEMIAKAAPDGYTLGLANTSSHATAPAMTPVSFDPIKDFTPVAMIGSSPFVLLGSKKLPAHNMAELVTYARAHPNTLNYASAGPGTLSHLAGELFKKITSTQITHVPYRGTAQSVMDVLEGRMELLVGTINSTHEFVRQGKITAFATLATTRSPSLPDTPTTIEAGVPGCEAALWTALVTPAGVPKEIIDKLNSEMNVVMQMPEVNEALRKQGIDPQPGSAEVVAAAIKADVIKWRNLVVTAKLGRS
jgi:tripartite-type tricarboxylate transporter receptor subunit TctC